MSEVPDLDTVLNACGHKHRRIILATLATEQQSLSVDDLTGAVIEHNHHRSPTETDDETFKQVSIGLYQVHLPKLAEAEFIQYDHEQKVVEPTAQLGREESHLSAVLAMDSELPTS